MPELQVILGKTPHDCRRPTRDSPGQPLQVSVSFQLIGANHMEYSFSLLIKYEVSDMVEELLLLLQRHKQILTY